MKSFTILCFIFLFSAFVFGKYIYSAAYCENLFCIVSIPCVNSLFSFFYHTTATRAEGLENEASQENEHTDVAVNDEEQQETTEENDEEETENNEGIYVMIKLNSYYYWYVLWYSISNLYLALIPRSCGLWTNEFLLIMWFATFGLEINISKIHSTVFSKYSSIFQDLLNLQGFKLASQTNPIFQRKSKWGLAEFI